MEPINYNPRTTTLSNLALADLGALYRGVAQAANSGKIKMNLETDKVKSTLSSDDRQISVRNYTIIGKVLAADLIDWEKMQNHFLLTAASLNTQLLSVYDLGLNANGEKALLTPDKIYDFFMAIMLGKVSIPEIDGSFSIDTMTENIR